MLQPPFFDPEKTYQQNYEEGPFGGFIDGKISKDDGNPTSAFLDTPVHLPFGIPAGPLLNGKFVKAALDKGFDIATYKIVRTQQHPTNEWPNVLAVKINGNLTLGLRIIYHALRKKKSWEFIQKKMQWSIMLTDNALCYVVHNARIRQ